MSELTRLTITLPSTHSGDEADLLLALLALYVSHGWEEQSLSTGEMQCIVHSGHLGFCAELSDALKAALPVLSVVSDTVQEENWAEAWKEFFTPVQGGEHFLVLAPWMERERAETGRIPIIIEPKTAFGTGHHATTALCLDALSDLHGSGRLRPGMRFLDLGTGSGILGIAAAKTGLCGDGLDIDMTAVDNALENRALNNVDKDSFSLRRGGVEEACGPYDLIFANILAAPLKDLAPQIVAAMKGVDAGGAWLILSGILTIQAQDVEAVYRSLGLGEPRRMTRDEWSALVFG